MAEEILANTVNDISNRGATNETLARFKGKPRQLVINIDDNYRPVIMDGSTLGGKFKAASTEELNNVKTTADNALTKEQGDEYYLGKTANAASASKLKTARTIELSGAVTGTATSFDGSGNITIPVTSVDASKVTGTLSINTTGNASTATTATTATTCTGNAATATKATQDASGNIITDTYATKTELNSTNENVSSLTTNMSSATENISTLQKSVSTINNTLETCFPKTGGTITGNTTVQGNIEATGTITGSYVYNAVWNDYAELFPKSTNTLTEEGDIIALDISSSDEEYKKAVAGDIIIGIHSESYGHLLGGDANKTLEENLKNNIPIALAGRVFVKVKGTVNLGDYIIPSDDPGIGIAVTNYQDNTVGRVVSYPINENKIKLVKVKVI